MKHATQVLAGLTSLLLATPTISQTFADDAIPDDRFALGIALHSAAPEYEGHDEVIGILYPQFQGKRISVDQDEIAFNFVPNSPFALEALLKRQHFGYDSSDADIFKGMADRHEIVGVGARGTLTTEWGQVGLDLLLNPIDDDDVEDADSGHSFNLHYGYPMPVGNFQVTPHIGYQWYSEEVIDFLYGVEANEVTTTRTRFNGEDAGVTYIGVNVNGALGDNLILTGGLRYESLPDEIANSPLVDDDNTYRAHVGLAWMF